jgi:hypothetical protein
MRPLKKGVQMSRHTMGSLGLSLIFLLTTSVDGQETKTQIQTDSQQPKVSIAKAKQEEIEKLIAQLGNRDFAMRERASKTLEEMGLVALSALRKAASDSTDAEVRKRAGDLVRTIERVHQAEIEFAWFDGLGFPRAGPFARWCSATDDDDSVASFPRVMNEDCFQKKTPTWPIVSGQVGEPGNENMTCGCYFS